MARPKTNHIDADEILQTIFRLTFGRIAQIDDELSAGDIDPHYFQELHRERRSLDLAGCDYRTELLAGGPLNDSERRAWQRVVAALEAERLVEIVGQRGSAIRLTAKGRKLVRESMMET